MGRAAPGRPRPVRHEIGVAVRSFGFPEQEALSARWPARVSPEYTTRHPAERLRGVIILDQSGRAPLQQVVANAAESCHKRRSRRVPRTPWAASNQPQLRYGHAMTEYTVQRQHKDRNRILSLVAAGLCVRCRKPHDGHSQRCRSCTAACVDSNRMNKRAARASEQCVECRAPWKGETLRCPDCKLRQSARWARRTESDHCSRCGNLKDGTHHTCAACRETMREASNRRRQKYRDDGKCVQCGQPRTGPSLYCDEHILKTAAYRWLDAIHQWPALAELLACQQGRCAYTGEQLVLGSNASLDHKVPRSRGGPNSIENVHWVAWKINRMKTDLSHDEFVGICKLIASRFP